MPVHQLLRYETTRDVIGAFYDVYQVLGFGFLEHVYFRASPRDSRIPHFQGSANPPKSATLAATHRVPYRLRASTSGQL
jgi:PD-(D/E)XK nuclease superfamily protein